MSRAYAGNAKLAELMLYLAEGSKGDPHFGRTKLAFLLFHCDFGAYATFREPVTGAVYRKQPLGPVADQEPDALHDLEASGAAHVAPTERWLIPLRPADRAMFDPSELALIDGVITRHHGEPVQLSELEREFAGWRYARTGDAIPYYSVLVRPNGHPDRARGQQDIRPRR
jgi:hypothetical protein